MAVGLRRDADRPAEAQDLVDRASGGERQQRAPRARPASRPVRGPARARTAAPSPRCARPTARRLPRPSSPQLAVPPGRRRRSRRTFYGLSGEPSRAHRRHPPAGCGAARRAGPARHTRVAVCGLLGLLTSGADAERAGGTGRATRCAARATAARTRAAPGTTPTSCSASTGCRSSTSSTPTSRCTGHRPGPTAATRSSSTARSTTTSSCATELAREHGATFATEGDTEAIVAAYHHWGPAAVARLRGMFAFLIWDAQERVLFGARDPFGIKPLFFATGPAGVAFASEKKSLLELARRARPAPTAPPAAWTSRRCSTT